jgi:hypothetical protein
LIISFECGGQLKLFVGGKRRRRRLRWDLSGFREFVELDSALKGFGLSVG